MGPCNDNKSCSCGSFLTILYINGNWNWKCPVCGYQERADFDKRVTKQDRTAGRAYLEAQKGNYELAEVWFLESYNQKATRYKSLNAGYLWWAVKCCFGIEYVQKKNGRYSRVIARFPLNEDAISEDAISNEKNKTIEAYSTYQSKNNHSSMMEEYEAIRSLYRQTISLYLDAKNHYDVFVAWHNRDNCNDQCEQFARELFEHLNSVRLGHRQRIDTFVSFCSLKGVTAGFFEPSIYCALATARILIVVIDDYNILDKNCFLKWEIKRMNSRPDTRIIYCGMKDSIGPMPDLQFDPRDCVCGNKYLVENIGNRVMNTLIEKQENPETKIKNPKEPIAGEVSSPTAQHEITNGKSSFLQKTKAKEKRIDRRKNVTLRRISVVKTLSIMTSMVPLVLPVFLLQKCFISVSSFYNWTDDSSIVTIWKNINRQVPVLSKESMWLGFMFVTALLFVMVSGFVVYRYASMISREEELYYFTTRWLVLYFVSGLFTTILSHIIIGWDFIDSILIIALLLVSVLSIYIACNMIPTLKSKEIKKE